MKTMRLLLVRHGQTRFNREQRVQGLTDTELDETGLKQADAVAAALKDEAIVGVYSSPLRRARQTAEAIARCHGLPVAVLEGLKEMDVGELDGLTFAEMNARYADMLKAWAKDAGAVRLPGGETLAEVQQRVWTAIELILSRHQGGTAVVVSHAFALQTVLCKALAMPLCNFRRIRHDLGAISTIELRGGVFVLKALNDACHLPNTTAGWIQL